MVRAFFFLAFLRVAALALAAGGLAPALGQTDPPGRIARINDGEGKVAFAPSGDSEWTDADLNRPLAAGDQLWTDPGVRAEIQLGSSVVRMDGRTRLALIALDDRVARLAVTQGAVRMRVRNLPEGEDFEVDTPNLAFRVAYPGDWRIDVDAQRGVTRVTVLSGTGAVYGDKGQARALGGGQQVTFKGRALEKVDAQKSPPQDKFDRWAAERNRREDRSVAARYVPREAAGYPLLDGAGEWRQDANHGPVWFPQNVAANWAPYREGRWEWLAPWGWTWIDDAPWAFVTSHYGRWAQVGARWAWVPGRMGLKPVYAPALVAFVGNGDGPLAIGGKPAVAWFPLAPGEAWRPPYAATPRYISSVNANMPPFTEGGWAYQRKAEALTAVSLDDFYRGKPGQGGRLRVAANALANAQVTAPPASPDQARGLVQASAAPTSREAPPQAKGEPTVRQQIAAQDRARQAQPKARREAPAAQARVPRELQARAGQDRRAREARIAGQRRTAQPRQRTAEPARRAKPEQVARSEKRGRDAKVALALRARRERARNGEQARQTARAQQLARARRAAEREALQRKAAEEKARTQRDRELSRIGYTALTGRVALSGRWGGGLGAIADMGTPARSGRSSSGPAIS